MRASHISMGSEADQVARIEAENCALAAPRDG